MHPYGCASREGYVQFIVVLRDAYVLEWVLQAAVRKMTRMGLFELVFPHEQPLDASGRHINCSHQRKPSGLTKSSRSQASLSCGDLL
jgi:hypothetical protein